MSEQRSASDFTPEDHARSMVDYIRAGTEAAYALGNRGPLKLTASGQLEAHILDAYWQHGFYVFEQVIGPEELSELREDVDRVLASAPIAPEADVDAIDK